VKAGRGKSEKVRGGRWEMANRKIENAKMRK
jgi:hypothetical protein